MTSIPTFVFIYLTIDLIILFSMLIKSLLLKYREKPKNIFQFKIYSYNFTLFFAFLYILFFFLIGFSLRIFRLGQSINLRDLWHFIYSFLNRFFFKLPLFEQVFICIYFILFLLFFSFCIALITKFLLKELYKLHIYHYYYKDPTYDIKDPRSKSLYRLLHNKLENRIIGHFLYKNTIFYLIIYRIAAYIETLLSGSDATEGETSFLAKYIWPFLCKKYLDYFFVISPFLIIFYECYFNNLILHKIFYYMPFYIIIILLWRYSKFHHARAILLTQLLWHFYYDENSEYIYCVSKKLRSVFTLFLQQNLLLTINGKYDEELADAEDFFCFRLIFQKHQLSENTYFNDVGVYIRIISKDKIVEELEDWDGNITFGEEYILLNDINNEI